MNWKVVQSLSNLFPGGIAGTIAGMFVSVWYWSDKSTRGCPLGSQIAGDCVPSVQTLFGQFFSQPAFTVACGAIGGVLGAALYGLRSNP